MSALTYTGEKASGKYSEAASKQRIFVVANQAAVAITAAMATTYTGLVVGNPTTSNVNLVVLKFGFASTVAVPTATVIGLMTGTGASVASALTPRNRYVGGVSSVAWAEDSCTLPGTPVLEQVFASAWTAATTAGSVYSKADIDLDGSLVLPPGAFVAAYSTAANTAAWIFSLMWEEIPLR